MSDDLKRDLTDIDGVGEKTAEKILGVLDEYDTGTDPYIEKAKAAAERGDDREAAVYLRRAGGE
jgi:Holliday junction resolvasome RuvABC DNA-binding subunit